MTARGHRPPRQLPLLIPPAPVYDEAAFLSAPANEAALTWLGRTELWPDHRLALWGESGRGKTHLLRIWAARRGAAWRDGANLAGFPDFDAAGGVAVDDADRAEAGALLHLLNTARDTGRPVLLSSRAAPARWDPALADLASRLRAMTAVEIGVPDDTLLRHMLVRWLAERKLVADPALHDRLLTHLPRRPEVLRAAVARLDADALVSRRREVTAPMLRAALAAAAEDISPAGTH
jgi:chromosomal replication initiation ATPase DnaA